MEFASYHHAMSRISQCRARAIDYPFAGDLQLVVELEKDQPLRHGPILNAEQALACEIHAIDPLHGMPAACIEPARLSGFHVEQGDASGVVGQEHVSAVSLGCRRLWRDELTGIDPP